MDKLHRKIIKKVTGIREINTAELMLLQQGIESIRLSPGRTLQLCIENRQRLINLMRRSGIEEEKIKIRVFIFELMGWANDLGIGLSCMDCYFLSELNYLTLTEISVHLRALLSTLNGQWVSYINVTRIYGKKLHILNFNMNYMI